MRWFITSLFLLLAAVGVVVYKASEQPSPMPAQMVEKPDPRTIAGPNAPDEVHVVVEIQQGTQSRYVYDTEEELLRLEETKFRKLSLPGDFGRIPQTRTRNGAMLRAVVLTIDAAPPGTLLKARPIAVIVADEGDAVRNTVVAVPTADIRYRDVDSIADLQPDQKQKVIAYIKNYRSLDGRPAVDVSYDNAATARRIIEVAMEAFAKVKSE